MLKNRMLATQQASELEVGNAAYETLFQTPSNAPQPKVCKLPISKLHPFFTADIGFKPYSASKLQALAEHMAAEGQLERIIVRSIPYRDEYEILAGHNRTNAGRLNNWSEIEAEIVDADDERATTIAIATNLLRRQDLTIIERGQAYKALLEAQRRQGFRSDIQTSGEIRQKFDSGTFGEIRQRYSARKIVAEFFGVTEYEIRKAIKMTQLISELQEILEEQPKLLPLACAEKIADYPDRGYELEMLMVMDKKGSELDLRKWGGEYSFIMPAGDVTVRARFVEEAPTQSFADVSTDAYYYEAVKWAAKNGITGGVGNGLFAPDAPCTRAQIVTFLWRAAGSPEPKNASSFSDVPASAYYARSVAWAVENGITTGTGNGRFSPDATCTRAQSVTFLYRALSARAEGTAEFRDVPKNAYYADAVAWAAANGITTGIGGGLFGPDNDCTRAQIVTFLFRTYNK